MFPWLNFMDHYFLFPHLEAPRLVIILKLTYMRTYALFFPGCSVVHEFQMKGVVSFFGSFDNWGALNGHRNKWGNGDGAREEWVKCRWRRGDRASGSGGVCDQRLLSQQPSCLQKWNASLTNRNGGSLSSDLLQPTLAICTCELIFCSWSLDSNEMIGRSLVIRDFY